MLFLWAKDSFTALNSLAVGLVLALQGSITGVDDDKVRASNERSLVIPRNHPCFLKREAHMIHFVVHLLYHPTKKIKANGPRKQEVNFISIG